MVIVVNMVITVIVVKMVIVITMVIMVTTLSSQFRLHRKINHTICVERFNIHKKSSVKLYGFSIQ